MAINVSKATKGSTYQLASQELKQNCSMCFTFNYYLSSINNSTINVNLVLINKTAGKTMLSLTDRDNTWHKGQVEIADIDTEYTVKIRL